MKGSNYITVLVVLATSFMDQSESLQCYECTSAVSMQGCVTNQTVTTCPSILANPTCFTVAAKVSGVSTYIKSCTDSSLCKTSLACPGASSCTLNCCSTKLCNSARSTMPALQGMLTTFAAVSIMLFLAY